VSGPQLDRIERRERHRKFTLAVEDDDRAVEPEMDLDHPTDIAGATHPGQGQDPPTERDRVIMGNLAPVLTRRTPARDGHRPARLAKAGTGSAAGTVNPAFVAGKPGGQEGIGRIPVADLRQAQLDHQPILAGAP
jgi:hypothetical protein